MSNNNKQTKQIYIGLIVW